MMSLARGLDGVAMEEDDGWVVGLWLCRVLGKRKIWIGLTFGLELEIFGV